MFYSASFKFSSENILKVISGDGKTTLIYTNLYEESTGKHLEKQSNICGFWTARSREAPSNKVLALHVRSVSSYQGLLVLSHTE